MLNTTWVCRPTDLRLAIRGRTSNRRVMTCTPLVWLRLILFVSRHGYAPIDTDCHGIAAERVEEFSTALERGLLFTPQSSDHATQARAWQQMTAVPAETRLTTAQMALRECCAAMDRDTYVLGWSSPRTRTALERLRRFIIDEGGIRIERAP